jgi:hypothetical protein
MNAFDTYCLFQAIKLHFTSKSYDYFKYQGKVNLKLENFEKKKDKYFYYKLSRKYPIKETQEEFLVANFLDKDKIWVGNLVTDEAETVFLDRQKNLQSLSYIFRCDCESIFGDLTNPNIALKTCGDYPILLMKAVRKEISLETLCILNSILGFLPDWKEKIKDDVFWPKYLMKIEKYTPFLKFDVESYKTILKKLI